jgi:hypothetical protein
VAVRNLHHWFAQSYSRAEDDYRRASERGDVKRMDEALAKKQELEKGVTITVQNPEVLQ